MFIFLDIKVERGANSYNSFTITWLVFIPINLPHPIDWMVHPGASSLTTHCQQVKDQCETSGRIRFINTLVGEGHCGLGIQLLERKEMLC